MNQPELLEWFKNQYLSGNKDFMSIRDIKKKIPEDAYIGNKVNKLYAWGYLNVDVLRGWCRKFRIKETLVKKKDLKYQSPLGKDITVAEYRELSDQTQDDN